MSVRDSTQELLAIGLVWLLIPVVIAGEWMRHWWTGRATVRGTLALWLHRWSADAAHKEVARR